MKIAVACDHGGLALKNAVMDWLGKNGYEAVDYGTDSSCSCDYPVDRGEQGARGALCALLGTVFRKDDAPA